MLTVIPQETHRVHADWDDPICDTVALLDRAARLGRRFVDMNTCVSADHTGWNLHWPEGPRLNGFHWIWTGRRTRILRREIRRPMTDDELRRDVIDWHDSQIARWRRARHGGRRPGTVALRQKQARKRRVYICWETKSRAYEEPENAERLVEDCRASGWPAFFMTLCIGAWGPKLRAIHNAGGQTALLAHGYPKPVDLAQWRPYIDAIWGRFAGEGG